VASKLGNTLILFLFIRIALMAMLPVLGDEAYYFYWGMHPAGGYYDLPPMIGWWLAPFVKTALVPLWLRCPNLISWALISASLYEWLHHFIEGRRAKWIAASFALLPLPFSAVVMFPDIPLLFFSYFSAYLFFRAGTRRSESAFSFLISGALFGAAVLSKYFAVFLAPSFLIWFLIQPKENRRFTGLVWFCLGAMPFALQHLIWNESHCASNFVFNLVTRQSVSDGPVFQIVGLFVLYLLILSFPFLKAVFKRAPTPPGSLESLSKFLGLLWASPTVIFGITACLGRGQGFHWFLFTLPFFVMWAGLRLNESELVRAFRAIVWVTGSISFLLLSASVFPVGTLKPLFEHRFQFEFAELTHRKELIESILPDVKRAGEVFTEGYTFSSILNFDLQQYARANQIRLPEVSVWGSGSRFGRVFDWTSDFLSLDGKTLVIITPGPFPISFWSKFFNSLKTEARTFEGSTFYVSTGEGFKSALYLKDEFRKPIETYYRRWGARCSLWDLTHP